MEKKRAKKFTEYQNTDAIVLIKSSTRIMRYIQTLELFE